MRLVGVSMVAGLLLGGCNQSQEQRQRDVCMAVCDCVENTPSAVEACIVDDCLPVLPPVSDACLECVYLNSQSCGVLLDECEDPCTDTNSPLLGGM